MPCSPGAAYPMRSPTGTRSKCIRAIHVQCQLALYSVPSFACPPGQEVEVRLDSKLVRIYHKGRLIKVHQRQPEGGRSTNADDYPATVSRYTTRAPDHIKGEAAKLGPAVDQFAQRLFEGPLPWARIRQGHKLLRLGERYTPQRLDADCRRAWRLTSSTSVRRLERNLVQGPGTGSHSPTAPACANRPLRKARLRLRPC